MAKLSKQDKILYKQALKTPDIFCKAMLNVDLVDYQSLVLNTMHQKYVEDIGKNTKDLDFQKICVLKCRQSGFSYLSLLNSVYLSTMYQEDTQIVYVSYTEFEASAKIDKFLEIYETLPEFMKKKFRQKNKRKVELNTPSGRLSARIVSFGSTSVRGIESSKRIIVILDEAAFIHPAKQQEVYNSILPLFARCLPGSALLMISTPFKQSGLFWDTWNNGDDLGFLKIQINWWDVDFLCSNVNLARKIAPTMTTEERVRVFGTKKLKEYYKSMTEEDFKQEFECTFSNFLNSFFTPKEIQDNVLSDLEYIDLKNLAKECSKYSKVYCGYDVARGNVDKACITVTVETEEEKLRLLYKRQMNDTPYWKQKQILSDLIDNIHNLNTLYIDSNGIGDNLREDLELKYPSKVKGHKPSAESKSKQANFIKKKLQNNELELPNDRDLIKDFLKVKREESANGFVYKLERDNNGHGDLYESFCYSCLAWINDDFKRGRIKLIGKKNRF